LSAALADPANAELASQYETFQHAVDEAPSETVPQLRETIRRLQVPESLIDALREQARLHELPLPNDEQTLRQCITGVWASKWTDRAYWARQRLGLAHDQLHMAVLVQAVVAFDYAFVLHTVDPTSGRADRLYGELVPGLGETLVGNEPGRPLAFTADKTSGDITLQSLPSKSRGLYGDGTIFRSDSNGEDLAGYAGAGLYDSVHAKSPSARVLDYAAEPIMWDPAYRHRLLETCVQIGLWVEKQMGEPQDIEGGLKAEAPYLVQTRAQVGLNAAASSGAR
jgi:alpha-glucan,water dikinase